jgi:hypothetical protein
MNDKRVETFPEMYNSTAIFKHRKSVFASPKYKARKLSLYFTGMELRDFITVTWKLCSVS